MRRCGGSSPRATSSCTSGGRMCAGRSASRSLALLSTPLTLLPPEIQTARRVLLADDHRLRGRRLQPSPDHERRGDPPGAASLLVRPLLRRLLQDPSTVALSGQEVGRRLAGRALRLVARGSLCECHSLGQGVSPQRPILRRGAASIRGRAGRGAGCRAGGRELTAAGPRHRRIAGAWRL